MASSVPEDVLIEILTRLPVKSLLRFKCVCKNWYILIKSPSFINQHYHNKNNQTNLFVHHLLPHIHNNEYHYSVSALFSDKTLTTHQYISNYPRDVANVLGPVNGLLLLLKQNANLDLWNPATQQFRTLLEPNLNSYLPFILTDMKIGFGLDRKTNDHQVIIIWYFWDSRNHTVEDERNNRTVLVPFIRLYNLSTDSWSILYPDLTKIPSNPVHFHLSDYTNRRYPVRFNMSVHLNGVHYWISNTSRMIVLFDTGNEEFREINVPPGSSNLWYLTLYNDEIALISTVLPFDVWVMEQEGCWTKQFTIRHLPQLRYMIGFWEKNEMFFGNESSELTLLNIDTSETRNIGIGGLREYRIRALKYKASLVSLNSESDKAERRLLRIVRPLKYKASLVSLNSESDKAERRSLLGIVRDFLMSFLV